MLKMLAGIWIVLGMLWLLKPQWLKSRIQKKATRRMKWTVYIFLIAFGMLITGSVIKAPGWPAKVAGVVGAILAIKGMLLLFTKASDRLWEWWASQPIIYFRFQALAMLALGIIIWNS